MKKTNFQVNGIGALFVATGLFKYAWNKVMPEVFGLKKLSYKQSIFLAIVVKSLFGVGAVIKDSFNMGNNTTTHAKPQKIEEKAEDKVEVCIEEENCNCDELKTENTCCEGNCECTEEKAEEIN